MPTKRASQSLLAIPGAGKRQANFATEMATADITFLFPDTAKTFYKLDQTREDVLDCSGQELYQRLLLGEIGDISVSFDATPKIIALLAAYGLGVAAAPTGTNPYTHALTELPLDVYQGPVFSAVFGFRGGADPLLLRGCTINSFSLSGKARQKITGQANIKFAEAAVEAGFVFPACVNETALRFQDTALTVDAENLAELLRSWDFSYDLKLLTDDHAYTNASSRPTRLERSDRRERRINYAILGDNSDAAYIAAEAGAQAPVILELGASPNKVTFSAPNTQLELDGGGLAKDGQAGETNIKIAGMPMINGVALPLSASVINAQSTAFLVVSP